LQKIAIIGAGGLGLEIKMLIDQINKHSKAWDFVGFYDDNPKVISAKHPNQIIGPIERINDLKSRIAFIIAIGDPKIKAQIFSRISNGKYIWYPSLIHPNVYVDNTNKIGEGTIITAGNQLTVNIDLKNHVLLNLNCTVGHNVIIDDFSSIMPGANISGNIKLGKKVLVGSGATLINECIIGDNSIVGAGAVVLKNIPENTVVAGVPSKPLIRKTK
jgi:sugar O-acyltransferase (sialic acid O-acetyltransferase NeuD family)